MHRGKYRNPEFDWLDTIAPTSILFFDSGKLGAEYTNDLFVGSVKNGILHFDLNGDRTHLDLHGNLSDKIADNSGEIQDVTFAKNMGIITDLQVGPDANMYVLTNYKSDGTIFRVNPIGNNTIQ